MHVRAFASESKILPKTSLHRSTRWSGEGCLKKASKVVPKSSQERLGGPPGVLSRPFWALLGVLGTLLGGLGTHVGGQKIEKAGKSWLQAGSSSEFLENLFNFGSFGALQGPPGSLQGPPRRDFGPFFGELSEGILHEVGPTRVPSLSKVCAEFFQSLSKVCPVMARNRLLNVVTVHIWS